MAKAVKKSPKTKRAPTWMKGNPELQGARRQFNAAALKRAELAKNEDKIKIDFVDMAEDYSDELNAAMAGGIRIVSITAKIWEVTGTVGTKKFALSDSEIEDLSDITVRQPKVWIPGEGNTHRDNMNRLDGSEEPLLKFSIEGAEVRPAGRLLREDRYEEELILDKQHYHTTEIYSSYIAALADVQLELLDPTK